MAQSCKEHKTIRIKGVRFDSHLRFAFDHSGLLVSRIKKWRKLHWNAPTVFFVTHVHHSQLKNIAVVSNMRLPIEIVPSLTYNYFTASLNSAIHLKIVPFLLCIAVQMQLTFFFGTALAQLPVEISQWEENSDGFFISRYK